MEPNFGPTHERGCIHWTRILTISIF